METTQKKAASFKGIRSAGWVIVICFIIAVLIFHFVLGNPSNFMNNDPNNHPLPGNFLGTIYKGGFIVHEYQVRMDYGCRTGKQTGFRNLLFSSTAFAQGD